MSRFVLSTSALQTPALRQQLLQPGCGGYVAFEGWVREYNDNRKVVRLEYEAFAPLALSEGERIMAEACERFGCEQVLCAHRVGALPIGEIAVWVGVSAVHRDEAFQACRYIIDEIKHRLPIWKKEYYEDGESGWVNCERCGVAAASQAALAHEHEHD